VCIADDLGALVCGGTLVCTHTSAQSGPNQNIDLSNPVVRFGPEDATLLIHDSKILLNGDALFSVGGDTAGHVIWFYAPNYGRHIFSTRPHPKYQLREVEVLQNSRIVFESEGRRFEWIMSAPLTAKAAIARLWIMHDQYQPLNERKNPGGVIGAATHYEYILPVSKQ
jgi:hypothetical protein